MNSTQIVNAVLILLMLTCLIYLFKFFITDWGHEARKALNNMRKAGMT